MKKTTQYLVFIFAFLSFYTGSYCSLRLTKYLVHQNFITFMCSKEIQQKFQSDTGPVKDGYTSYEFESNRNQVGCGRIQKSESMFGEDFILPFFYPIAELEMRIRGFNSSTLHVNKYVAEFERYASNGNKVYFHRRTPVKQFTIDRSEQRF